MQELYIQNINKKSQNFFFLERNRIKYLRKRKILLLSISTEIVAVNGSISVCCVYNFGNFLAYNVSRSKT